MSEEARIAVAFFAGLIAGGINAVAGGGSLISFPMLAAGTGLTSKLANATNSVGLWPGSLAGALGYFRVFHEIWPRLKQLLPPTIVGGIIGALLLKATPTGVFDIIIPFLILFAVGILAFQKSIKEWTAKTGLRISALTAITIQFFLSIYGGYFGAGMGIMMLAVFSVYEKGTIHNHNALKNWLAMTVNFTITFVFIYQGMVVGVEAIPMIVGAVLGGFTSARLIQNVDPNKLRKGIVTYGLLSTVYFTIRIFHHF